MFYRNPKIIPRADKYKKKYVKNGTEYTKYYNYYELTTYSYLCIIIFTIDIHLPLGASIESNWSMTFYSRKGDI